MTAEIETRDELAPLGAKTSAGSGEQNLTGH